MPVIPLVDRASTKVVKREHLIAAAYDELCRLEGASMELGRLEGPRERQRAWLDAHTDDPRWRERSNRYSRESLKLVRLVHDWSIWLQQAKDRWGLLDDEGRDELRQRFTMQPGEGVQAWAERVRREEGSR